jgi:tetratricopeptide (TPR) repeat protein
MNTLNQKDIRTLISEGNFNEVTNRYKKIVEIEPNNYKAYNNLGNALKELGKLKEAATSYRQAIKIKSDYTKAHFNLGNILNDFGKFKEAIPSLLLALKINPNYSEAHNCLAISYKKLKKFEQAITHYKKANTSESRAQILQCLYVLKKTNEYIKYLSKLCRDDPKNIKVASISTFVSNQLNLDNIYPFCKNPLKFIFFKNIKSNFIPFKKFINSLINECSNLTSVWESRTTKKGFQSKGNLFNLQALSILNLKKIILETINEYKIKYKTKPDGFITQWPNKFSLLGAYNRLLKHGYQQPHIHPAGWLSGCFYLKMPKPLKKSEGAINFSLHGYDYPIVNSDIPSYQYSPVEGDLILFPSSLFHKTIPFSSNDERHVIAFDTIPE